MPLAGELVDLVPELAPRLRVDAGGRLVEQQQLRLVHHAGGQRQPLLPAAGERAGELVAAVRRGRGARAPRRRARARSGTPYMPRDEVEVLARSSGPRRARTAASCSRPARLICVGLACGCRSRGTVPSPASGVEQAAEHADGGRLAAAVGPEEAEDLAARARRSRGRPRSWSPKRLARPAHVDGELAGHRDGSGYDVDRLARVKRRAASAVGRASTMKTSLLRFSRL